MADRRPARPTGLRSVRLIRKPMPPKGLRALRLMKGWPIGALAAEADMAESTIRRLETGSTKEPSQKTRRALSRVLGVSASKLFGR
jgi:transcriptional regulator with XRE-family HTH domain